jgi:hypothetical protein
MYATPFLFLCRICAPVFLPVLYSKTDKLLLSMDLFISFQHGMNNAFILLVKVNENSSNSMERQNIPCI